MGSSGSSSSSSTTYVDNTVRYADYIESKHQPFLNAVDSYRVSATDNSPFENYTGYDVNDAFFGVGNFIGNFPALYDIFGKFMAGLDVEAVFSQMYESTVNSPAIGRVVSAEATARESDIEDNVLPRLNAGQTDINSVMNKYFLTGKDVVDDAKTKAIAKFKGQLRYSLIPTAQARWATHLDWNKSVVTNYAEIMKLYYSSKMDTTEKNYSMAVSDTLWPFTVLDFERAALGVLQGAYSSSGKESIKGAGTSRGSNLLSGALSGSSMGGMMGTAIKPPTSAIQTTGSGAFSGMASGAQSPVMSGGGGGWGAGIGAALGMAASFF